MRKNGVVEMVTSDFESLMTNFPAKVMGLDFKEEFKKYPEAKQARITISLLNITHQIDFEDMPGW